MAWDGHGKRWRTGKIMGIDCKFLVFLCCL